MVWRTEDARDARVAAHLRTGMDVNEPRGVQFSGSSAVSPGAGAADAVVIGVDGGGSATRAVVLERSGRVLGTGAAGSCNYHSVGIDAAGRAISAAMDKALRAAGRTRDDLSAACWALPGVGRRDDRSVFRNLAATLLPNAVVRLEHDAASALIAGTGGDKRGVVLVAGTGMIVYGEADGRSVRAGGRGTALDLGSGYAIGIDVLRACGRANDGITPHSEMTRRVPKILHLDSTTALTKWVYSVSRSVTDVADVAPIAISAASQGDPIALEILTTHADALADAVLGVARRLGFLQGPRAFPLVLAGGLMTSTNTPLIYRRLVLQAVATRCPSARPTLPRASAAIGAALIAFRSIGVADIKVQRRPDGQDDDAAVRGSAASGPWTSETRNVLSEKLDSLPTLAAASVLHISDIQAVRAVRACLPAIAAAVDRIAPAMARGGRLIYVGAGTSGRLGVLDASECPPTFRADPSQVVGIIAGGQRALTRSIEGKEDLPSAGVEDLNQLRITTNDTVVGITASGRAPYVVGAVQEARRHGAFTVALVCNSPSPLSDAAELTISPLVGPEVVTGSTRMKAGTACKLVLNALSTLAMVRLGKTHGNLMVDVNPANNKLHARARRIVSTLTGCTEQRAGEVLAAAQNNVKVAIVSISLDVSPEVARARLAACGGVIRSVLDSATTTRARL